MKIVTLLTLALFIVLSAGGAQADRDLRPSVVDIEWNTTSGYERCAGVVIAKRRGELLVWTAEHCATNGFARMRFFDGQTVRGSSVRVVRMASTSDFAELAVSVDAGELKATSDATVTATTPNPGTTVTIIGHPVSALRGPAQGRWATTCGRFGEIVRNENGDEQFEVYCPQCGPGNSGSGVFDSAGRLIGVVFGVTEISGMDRQPDGRYADVVPSAVAARVARTP